MPKTIVADIESLGFKFEMFHIPQGEWHKYVSDVIASASAILAGRIGSARYANTTSPVKDYAKRAEICLCAAEMLERRINIRLANVVVSGASEYNRDAPNMEERARANYLAEAESLILKIVSDATETGAGYASRVYVSDPFNKDT